MEEKKKKNLLSRIISEYKNVTWADKKTVIQVTIIVLLITAFVATMIILFDTGFKFLLDKLSSLLKRVF